MMQEKLDKVDDCMNALGISLNLLDPQGSFGPGGDLAKIMNAVRADYQKLSGAIQLLREEQPGSRRLHATIRAASDIPSEYAIDTAIDRGLNVIVGQVAYPVSEVQLINAIPVFRPDGSLFVTVIAEVK